MQEVQSFLITLVVALPIEAGIELMRVANGDLTQAAFVALGIAVLRAIVKVLVYFIFPSLKASKN